MDSNGQDIVNDFIVLFFYFSARNNFNIIINFPRILQLLINYLEKEKVSLHGISN